MARLQEQYVNEIAPALNKKFGYKSVMQIPKLDKVVINVACGEAKDNEKILEAVMKDLGQITGQKAVVCRAKKSVANFKLRQGTPIGCKVMPVCPKCGKATRVGHSVKDGKTVRVCRKCGAEL